MEKTSITKTTESWNTINWAKVQRKVFKLQKRIFQAIKSGEKAKAHKLQKLLAKSYYAKLLSVRKVTQDNKGKKTAGVDGKKIIHPQQRYQLALSLNLKGYKSKPLRRVWISKPGKDEKRPLGIPTITDRAMQCLIKLCMEPYWEAKFEGNSYGFRPGRSTHDAIEAIFNHIRYKTKYVLDADISKCFDKINHKYLLDKTDCPYFKSIIKQWLKAGVMDKGIFESTDSGTPQGGVISPLLANIALDGMIRDIQKSFPNSITREGKRIRGYQPKIIRYADDFVILHHELEIINHTQKLVNKWLEKVGLELKPSKTRICHTLNDIMIDGKMEKAGFDFLGFTIKQHHVGKYQTGCNTMGEKLGFKTIIKPSKKSQQKHRIEIKRVIRTHRNAPQDALINKLNPIIRGWSNYFSTVCSKKIFSDEDRYIWENLKSWAINRSKKGKKEALNKYFSHGIHGKWTFQNKSYFLLMHSKTKIKRHIKVKDNASPYDGNWTYWSKRRGEYPETPKRVAKLLKKQKGKCNLCNQHFTPEDIVEIDHIIPKSKNGKDENNNLQALHRHCHDVKSRNDGSQDWSKNDYEWKEDVVIVPMTIG
ncbi:group II intron reverse transcriptase/maturase [Crocosphaera subtropica]|nr:group II intron reverse transcriptase/maturase [Crocosphaera subtropica]